MLINDFSQLSVMNGDRTLHGMVSWKSFGRAAARNDAGKVAGDFLDDKPLTLRGSTPLLEAIDEIIRREVVLVRDTDRSIIWLVTTTDVSAQLRTLSEAFLLLGEVEHHLRRLIQQAGFTPEELNGVSSPDSKRRIATVHEMSFGEYLRLLDSPQNWTRLNLNLDGAQFIKQLDAVRHIRNAVMHFRPDGPAVAELGALKNTARFLKHL